MALTVAAVRSGLIPPGGTAVRVVITAADDSASQTVSIDEAVLPPGQLFRLADVRARDIAGSATSWQPSLSVDGRTVYEATSGTPGDLADQPGCYIIRDAGETVSATFSWNSGSDNDGELELVFVPGGVA
jgi:hypothetical protein